MSITMRKLSLWSSIGLSAVLSAIIAGRLNAQDGKAVSGDWFCHTQFKCHISDLGKEEEVRVSKWINMSGPSGERARVLTNAKIGTQFLLNLTNEHGPWMPGSLMLVNDDGQAQRYIRAGNLDGVLLPGANVIFWYNDSFWTRNQGRTEVAWKFNGECRFDFEGPKTIRARNEKDQWTPIVQKARGEIKATAWDNLTGHVLKDGSVKWDNGTHWRP